MMLRYQWGKVGVDNWRRLFEVACFRYERDALDYAMRCNADDIQGHDWLERRFVVRRAEHLRLAGLTGCSYRFAVVKEERC